MTKRVTWEVKSHFYPLSLTSGTRVVIFTITTTTPTSTTASQIPFLIFYLVLSRLPNPRLSRNLRMLPGVSCRMMSRSSGHGSLCGLLLFRLGKPQRICVPFSVFPSGALPPLLQMDRFGQNGQVSLPGIQGLDSISVLLLISDYAVIPSLPFSNRKV